MRENLLGRAANDGVRAPQPLGDGQELVEILACPGIPTRPRGEVGRDQKKDAPRELDDGIRGDDEADQRSGSQKPQDQRHNGVPRVAENRDLPEPLVSRNARAFPFGVGAGRDALSVRLSSAAMAC